MKTYLIRGTCLLIQVFLVLNTGFLTAQNRQMDTLSIEKIFEDRAYTTKTPDGLSYRLSEDSYYLWQNNSLVKVSQNNRKETVKEEVLIEWVKLASQWNLPIQTDIQSFIWNKTRDKILLLSDKEAIYRHSYKTRAYLVILNPDNHLEVKTVWNLSSKEKIELPTFSPDGSRVAYVRENNLYYLDLNVSSILSGDSVREKAVSSDGKINEVLNGKTDWVYEEEFGVSQAYEWSPNGAYLAFLRMDETSVKQYGIKRWGPLYPSDDIYKYPKAGEENSKVSLRLYRLGDGALVDVACTSDSVEYIPRFRFTPQSSTLLFYTLNRAQNNLSIWKVKADSSLFLPIQTKASRLFKPQRLYQEQDPCYVEVNDDFYCFSDESRFIISSEREGFRQLYLYDFNGNKIRAFNGGKYEVSQFYGVDEKRKVLYFQANYTATYNKDVMVVGLNGKGLRRLAYDMQVLGGVTHAMFSKDFSRAILIHSRADMPPKYCEYAMNGKNEQLLKVIESNDTLLSKMQALGIVRKVFGKMAVGSYRTFRSQDAYPVDSSAFGPLLQQTNAWAISSDTLSYWIMKPDKMEEGRKYPVLMYLYGGPGSEQVLNQYGKTDYWWYAYLVQQGYVVICVDNRGTGGKGREFKKCTYLQLGRYETEDQMAVVRYICDRWDFVDAKRIGIWGWSYGGFMSSSCLFKGEGLWKMAIAVAPVTNWRYYDNIYTERFMRTPAENAYGYDANSPTYMAHKLQGHYLLVHGSGDDNVHLQNSMDLVTALQKSMKQFQIQIYPNKNHGISGGNTRKQLYTCFTQFILQNL